MLTGAVLGASLVSGAAAAGVMAELTWQKIYVDGEHRWGTFDTPGQSCVHIPGTWVKFPCPLYGVQLRQLTHNLTHSELCWKVTKNTRNPKISGVFWNCWADLNRRPHPYQRENLTFSSHFRSFFLDSLHSIYFLPLFSHRFSIASTAVCGCLFGQKAFPLKNRSAEKPFSVCSLPLSEGIGNCFPPFRRVQILRRDNQRVSSVFN